MRMSKRNTREGKARRRADRERQRRSMTMGPGTQAVEVRASQVAPGPAGASPRNSDEHDSGPGSDSDGGLIAAEPGEADLDPADLDPADLDTEADLENAEPG